MTRILAVLLLVACAHGVPAQTPPPGGLTLWWEEEERLPTPMHRFIYHMTAECLGMNVTDEDFAGISWFVADFIQMPDRTRLGGLWIREPRQIILDRNRTWNHPEYISHELIHDLTNGEVEHGDPLFDECTVKTLAP